MTHGRCPIETVRQPIFESSDRTLRHETEHGFRRSTICLAGPMSPVHAGPMPRGARTALRKTDPAPTRQALRWQDVRNALLREIRTMNVGDRLHSVEQLATRLGCSERPVNRALEWLGAQGYLTLRRGARAQLVTNQPHGVLGLGGVREFGDELEVISGSIYSVNPGDNPLAHMAAQVLKAPEGTPLAVVDRVRRLRPSKSRPKNAVRWDRSFMVASQVGDLW